MSKNRNPDGTFAEGNDFGGGHEGNTNAVTHGLNRDYATLSDEEQSAVEARADLYAEDFPSADRDDLRQLATYDLLFHQSNGYFYENFEEEFLLSGDTPRSGVRTWFRILDKRRELARGLREEHE